MALSLMVVNNIDVVRVAVDPTKADPPLCIDPNSVLASPISG
jgi:hypothetical protein